MTMFIDAPPPAKVRGGFNWPVAPEWSLYQTGAAVRKQKSGKLARAAKNSAEFRRENRRRHVAQNVADGDDAAELPLLQHRQMAIAADVHFVQGKGDLVVDVERLGRRGHKISNRPVGQFRR